MPDAAVRVAGRSAGAMRTLCDGPAVAQLASRAARAGYNDLRLTQWRSAMATPVKVLYTAHATAVGGRNGHTQSDDGLVSVDLSVPKAMGGPGKPGTTTPEDLFAAGYAACFGGACEFMAKQMKLNPGPIDV